MKLNMTNAIFGTNLSNVPSGLKSYLCDAFGPTNKLVGYYHSIPSGSEKWIEITEIKSLIILLLNLHLSFFVEPSMFVSKLLPKKILPGNYNYGF